MPLKGKGITKKSWENVFAQALQLAMDSEIGLGMDEIVNIIETFFNTLSAKQANKIGDEVIIRLVNALDELRERREFTVKLIDELDDVVGIIYDSLFGKLPEKLRPKKKSFKPLLGKGKDCGCGRGPKKCISKKLKGKGALLSEDDILRLQSQQEALAAEGKMDEAIALGERILAPALAEAKKTGSGKNVNYMLKLYKKECGHKNLKGKALEDDMVKFASNKLKKMDCGCGCNGMKTLGRLSGGVLKPCPPGYSEYGIPGASLLCKRDCPPGYRDDTLACRGCPPGWNDAGASCVKLAYGFFIIDSAEQDVIWKDTVERIDWKATGENIKKGFEDAFSENGPLAQAFDPEKNGVAKAFREFGENTEAAFKEVGDKLNKAFDPKQNGVADAFNELGKKMTDTLGNADWWKDTMTDPDTWITIIGVIAGVAATVLSGGAAGPLVAAGLNALGPSLQIISDAAQGKPISPLDIASIGLAFIPVPGASAAAAAGQKALAEGVEAATKTALKETAEQRLVALGKTVVNATTGAAKSLGKTIMSVLETPEARKAFAKKVGAEIAETVTKVGSKLVKTKQFILNPKQAAEFVAEYAQKNLDEFLALPLADQAYYAAQAGLNVAYAGEAAGLYNTNVIPTDWKGFNSSDLFTFAEDPVALANIISSTTAPKTDVGVEFKNKYGISLSDYFLAPNDPAVVDAKNKFTDIMMTANEARANLPAYRKFKEKYGADFDYVYNTIIFVVEGIMNMGYDENTLNLVIEEAQKATDRYAFKKKFGKYPDTTIAEIGQFNNYFAKANRDYNILMDDIFGTKDAVELELKGSGRSGSKAKRESHYSTKMSGTGANDSDYLAYLGIEDKYVGSGGGRDWESMYLDSQRDIHNTKMDLVRRRAEQRTVKIKPFSERPTLLSDTFKEGPYGRDITGQIQGGARDRFEIMGRKYKLHPDQIQEMRDVDADLRMAGMGGLNEVFLRNIAKSKRAENRMFGRGDYDWDKHVPPAAVGGRRSNPSYKKAFATAERFRRAALAALKKTKRGGALLRGGDWFSPSTWTWESVNPVNWTANDWSNLAKGADATLFGILADPYVLKAAQAALVAGGTFTIPGIGTVGGEILAAVLQGAIMAHEYVYPSCEGGKTGVLGCNEFRKDVKEVVDMAVDIAKMVDSANDKLERVSDALTAGIGEDLIAQPGDFMGSAKKKRRGGDITQQPPVGSMVEFYYPQYSTREARGVLTSTELPTELTTTTTTAAATPTTLPSRVRPTQTLSSLRIF